jgi:hypothetical protein
MGDSVSNLSGHHFDANGTYAVKTIGGAPTLELRHDFVGPTVEHYLIGGTPTAPTLKFDGDDAAFALRPLPAPATIRFDANAAPHVDGTIVGNAPLLVEYAANRDQCPVSESQESVILMGGSNTASPVPNQLVAPFPVHPVNGSFRLLLVAPSPRAVRPTLTLWFEDVTVANDGSPRCNKWDSNFGANYSFDMR